MRIKEKVIRQALKKIDNRRAKITTILDGDHITGMLNAQREGIALARGDNGNFSDTVKKLSELVAEEKRCRRLFDRQTKDMESLIDEQIKLEGEKRELENELFLMGTRGQLT